MVSAMMSRMGGLPRRFQPEKVQRFNSTLVHFRDTAGQERFRTITTAYYRGAMGIMLVYDITQEKSFENIKNWIRNIEENASADVEKMLLGNKCELNDKRQVGVHSSLSNYNPPKRPSHSLAGYKRARRTTGCRVWNQIR